MRLVTVITYFVFSLVSAYAAESTRSLEFWRVYRATTPFPSQDVIASPISESGSMTLVITEPPEETWTKGDEILKKIFQNNLVSVHRPFQRLGFDGWTRDIVIDLREMNDVRLAECVAELSIAFFGTSYGASYRTFSPNSWDQFARPSRHLAPPNLQINAATINDWLLFNPKVSFYGDDAPDSTKSTLADIIEKDRPGVYRSDKPGIVILVFDRKKRINYIGPQLRKFSLDTDALIGAIATKDSSLLALVGRERTTSIVDMPPIRIDTIITLGATRKENLAQSYERNLPLAGFLEEEKLQNFVNPIDNTEATGTRWYPRAMGVDWAPILLSRDLAHTEYGQLLNITDQMLKGWSLANATIYGNFPYPAPTNYPNAAGVHSHLMSKLGPEFNVLTFNWNTAGFGTWTEYGKFDIFTVSNTNALPVSYIPEGSGVEVDDKVSAVIRAAEDEYGKFFAERRDPYLNRVAQYAALHVIFTRYPIEAKRVEPMMSQDAYDARWDKYERLVADAIEKFSHYLTVRDAVKENTSDEAGSVELAKILSDGQCAARLKTDALFRLVLQMVPQEHLEVLKRYAKGERSGLDAFTKGIVNPHFFTDNLESRFRLAQQERENIKLEGERYNTDAGACNISPNLGKCFGLDARYTELNAAMAQLDARETELAEEYKSFQENQKVGASIAQLLPIAGNCREAWQAVQEPNNYDPEGVYKTPSIVVSMPVDGNGTGGHNLDGRAVRVVPDANIPVGTVSIGSSGDIIYINPKDISKSSVVSREFERSRQAYLRSGTDVQRKIVGAVESRLRTTDDVIRPYTSVSLGRESETELSTGLLHDNARNFVGPRQIRLTPDALASARAISQDTGADVIASVKDGVFTLVKSEPPPLALATTSPSDFLRGVEIIAERSAQTQKSGRKSLVVVSDGTIGIQEMDGIRITAQARAVVAEGSGGDIPPSNFSRFGTFFERDRDGGKGWRRFTAFPFKGLVERLLRRTDADWAMAAVDRASFHVAQNERTVVGRLVIPFKTRDSSLVVKVKAYFTGRKATEADAELIGSIVEKELKAVPAGTEISSKIIDIRESLLKELAGNAKLQMTVKQDKLDFFVVEWMHSQVRHEQL